MVESSYLFGFGLIPPFSLKFKDFIPLKTGAIGETRFVYPGAFRNGEELHPGPADDPEEIPTAPRTSHEPRRCGCYIQAYQNIERSAHRPSVGPSRCQSSSQWQNLRVFLTLEEFTDYLRGVLLQLPARSATVTGAAGQERFCRASHRQVSFRSELHEWRIGPRRL